MSHTYRIRLAKLGDIPALAVAGKEFDAESVLYPTPIVDAELYQDFADAIGSSSHFVAVAYDEADMIAGFAIWGVGKVFARSSKEALMTFFYTRKAHRNLKLSDQLLDYSINLCKDMGAKTFFASSTGGFADDGKNERAFTALLKRRGFEVLGSILSLRES